MFFPRLLLKKMWERAHVGFGGTGRKRKGPCMKQAWLVRHAPGRSMPSQAPKHCKIQSRRDAPKVALLEASCAQNAPGIRIPIRPPPPTSADGDLSSTELESGIAIGAFLQTPAPVLDKISGPMGARFLSSTGLQSGNLIERAHFFPAPALDKNRSPTNVCRFSI